MRIKIREIDTKGVKLKFIKTLRLKCCKGNGAYFCDYPNFNIFVFGTNKEEIIKEINLDIIYLWKTYAKNDDEKMTQDAVNLKKKLLSMIKEKE